MPRPARRGCVDAVDDALDIDRRDLVEASAQKAVEVPEQVGIALASSLAHLAIPAAEIFGFDGFEGGCVLWDNAQLSVLQDALRFFSRFGQTDKRVTASADALAIGTIREDERLGLCADEYAKAG